MSFSLHHIRYFCLFLFKCIAWKCVVQFILGSFLGKKTTLIMKRTEKLNIIMSDILTTKPEHLRGTPTAILCKILIIGVTILNHLRGVRLTLEVRLWDTAVTEPPDVFWPIVALLISTKWDCVCLQGAANTLTALPPHADTLQSCSLNHPKNTQKYKNSRTSLL